MKVRPTHPSEMGPDSPSPAAVTVTFSEEEATVIAHVLNLHIEDLNDVDHSEISPHAIETVHKMLEVISTLYLILVNEYDDHT